MWTTPLPAKSMTPVPKRKSPSVRNEDAQPVVDHTPACEMLAFLGKADDLACWQ